MTHLANVAVLADYYGMMPTIAPVLEAALWDYQGLWESVSRHSAFYLGLAYMIRSREIFEDALRHSTGLGLDCSPPLRRSVLPVDVVALCAVKHSELLMRITSLDQALANIDFNINKPFFRKGPWVHGNTRRDNARFLARSIWLDWLAVNNRGQKTGLGSGALYRELLDNAERESIRFLGQGAGQRASRTFQQPTSRQFNQPEQRAEVVYCLHEHLRQARRIIEEFFYDESAPAAKHQVLDNFYVTNLEFSSGRDRAWGKKDEYTEEEEEEEEDEDTDEEEEDRDDREDAEDAEDEQSQDEEDEKPRQDMKDEPAQDKNKVWPDASKEWLEQVGWEHAREMRAKFMAQVDLQLKTVVLPDL